MGQINGFDVVAECPDYPAFPCTAANRQGIIVAVFGGDFKDETADIAENAMERLAATDEVAGTYARA